MAKSKTKYVYFFGDGKAEGDTKMKALLGGKGANLAEMSSIGLPVPPGFTISTEACEAFQKAQKWPTGLADQVDKHLKRLENATGKTFGSGPEPLLVSVRSGAAVSMPGMMDTVLNLGLNDETRDAMIELTGNERFVWDAYRRFMQMFGDVVLGMEHEHFEEALQKVKDKHGAKLDTDLDVDGLKQVVAEYEKVYKRQKQTFPQNVKDQLRKSVDAVFGSWNNPRAIRYRELNDIRGLKGTAVNVQTMVFGNMGDDSGTGVAFTRDPSTGKNTFYGEFLMNAQGEDVVAGIRTPEPIADLRKHNRKVYKELREIRGKLEDHYRDMQDFEFTIERGTLYMLQTRTGKRTAVAAVKIAADMMKEGLIDEKESVLRLDPRQVDQLLHPWFDQDAEGKAQQVGKGLPASPGAATGRIVFNADDAEKQADDGKQVILCRIETSPEDIGGMHAAEGILTTRGGMTSHAAVVARGMGKCCVAGCGELTIDYKAKTLSADGKTFKEGEWISLNGTSGVVYAGKIDTVEPKLTGPFAELMKLSDKYRTLGVRTNADTPHDVDVAVRFGAEGIGLCRTEHMFFEGDRIVSMRKMILADDEDGRRKALAEIEPRQRDDFIGIFKALKGRPATIRLLDPPLHEFVPHDSEGQKQMAEAMGISVKKVRQKVDSLHEFNPMLGHRGCRLGIAYPEITAMQARAIVEAAYEVRGAKAEIMIPLVGNVKELAHQKRIVEQVIEEVKAANKGKKAPPIKIGTMIEVPRGAVTADAIAAEAEFFSFGTNDLTQMGCGFSRDDAGKFLKQYVEEGIYDADPFQSLDRDGVGELVRIAVEKGRSANKALKLGICGEHGGDPSSIAFCHEVGLDYVSCSPYRVPVARLAAAQAVIRHGDASKAARKSKKSSSKSATKTKKRSRKAGSKKSARKSAKKSAKKLSRKRSKKR
ncbi:MAG: pyruvate, phosphate dikinase [Phycisphaerae bacterium]|nr:pyruvate, phosphate dikinase [Phycisphaerae bacterium]